RRPRELRRGVPRRRHVALAGQHRLVHAAVDGAARRHRSRHGRARRAGAAGSVAVAALVLHAVPARLDGHQPDLDLDLQPAARCGQRRHGDAGLRGARLAAGPGHRDARHRDRHRLVDDRRQLPALPRGAAEHPVTAVRGGLDRRRRPVPPVLVDHAAAAAADDRAHPAAAGAGVAEAVRPGVPDDRRRPGWCHPVDPPVRVRGRFHRVPVRLLGRDLVRVLRDDHRDLARPAPRHAKECLMSAAAPAAPAAAGIDRRGRGPSRTVGPGRVVAFVVLVLMAVAWLLPFLWAVDTALKTEEDAASPDASWIPANGFTLDSFREVLAVGNVPLWAWNSLLTSVLITAITAAISALAAYAFARIDFKGRGWLYAVVIASIMVPGQVLIIPLYYEMLALRLVDTYWGLILPQVVAPAMVFILKKFFDQVPIELEDAARID